MEACESRLAEIGLINNLLIRPLNAKHFMTEAELAEERRLAHERAARHSTRSGPPALTAGKPQICRSTIDMRAR